VARARAWLGVAIAGVAACAPREAPCRERARTGAPDAIPVCEAIYRRARVPSDGADLASLYVSAGRFGEAAAIAAALLTSPERGAALRVLGIVASRDDRDADALVYLESARALHRGVAARSQLARDNHALAGALRYAGRFGEALVAVDAAMATAPPRDGRFLGYAHMLAADILAALGHVRAAEVEIEAAADLLGQADAAWLEFKTGTVALRAGNYHAAARALEQSLAAQGGPELQVGGRLNLAFALLELGRLDEAERLMAALDASGGPDTAMNRDFIAGSIAAARGRRRDAAVRLTRAYDHRISDDWGATIATALGELFLADDAAAAKTWLGRAVEHSERVVRAESIVELRPWLLAEEGRPYELLFALLASSGAADEAFAVWDLLQGRALRDLLATARGDLVGRDRIALRGQSLRRIASHLGRIPAADRGPARVPPPLDGRDLLVLAVADGQVWVGTIIEGRRALRRAGAVAELEPWIWRLVRDPRDRGAAARLGDALVPSAEVPPADRPLHVVIDPRLSALPLAAVQRAGRRLVEDRALTYAPSLSAIGCRPRPRASGRRVIGDPLGDLPAARRESTWVGDVLGSPPMVGARASRASVLAAGQLLHIAAHGTTVGGVAALRMADGVLGADEIALAPAAPQLVVLAVCGSAVGPDPENLGALSSAYLAAGAQQVVATTRPVTDEGAADLIRRFYRAGGAYRPVAALAAAQRAAAADGGRADWAFFVAYGEDGECPREAEGRL